MYEEILNKEYLTANEVLHLIDFKFNYTFEGKDEDDHLVTADTWRSYLRQFYEEKEDEGKDISAYYDKLRGGNKNRKYHIDFVEEIIEFRSDRIKKLFNSDRKTMIDKDWVNLNKVLMGWSDKEVPKSVYDKRVIITEYALRKENRFPTITEEEKVRVKEQFINALVDELFDKEKINEDVEEWITKGELIHGYAEPFEMIEDDEGPIGFRLDRKKYLKNSVINEIKNT